MLDIDWSELFGFSVSPLEMIIRGTVMFWFLFALFRLVLRRDVGSVAMADILIFVIIADAAQNALSGDYKSISDGMVLVATIVGWNVIVDWASFKSAFLHKLLEPPPLHLVKDGRVNHRALRGQFMRVSELEGMLREHGVSKIEDVKAALFESNGELSVIKREGTRGDTKKPKRPARPS